jgi:hypothetical protein
MKASFILQLIGFFNLKKTTFIIVYINMFHVLRFKIFTHFLTSYYTWLVKGRFITGSSNVDWVMIDVYIWLITSLASLVCRPWEERSTPKNTKTFPSNHCKTIRSANLLLSYLITHRYTYLKLFLKLYTV